MNPLFEIESARVKGISFHPIYPWVITSCHNGTILLYDYIHKMLIEEFSEHDGPVRSVHFHNTQPFFVSGGDDTTIKVWNYTTRKCQFTLTGHKDYVRTVQFHHELPWIISSSDDMTIRVWNWLNRTMLSTASGHDHYVMTAFFHPTVDWIVSASLDSTIRIWDYSVLRKKFFEARSNTFEVLGLDITMIHKLEGHERGVNWAIFHPTLNLIASASDDKLIKIWKYSNSSWNEADSLRGHMNNVSSVIFHPKYDFIISDSEDKSIRIWDLNKKSSVEKIIKENDRFWILSSHPSISLFAAGSDSGIIVFKLENTRIPSTAILNNVLFYQNKAMRLWNTTSTEKKQIYNIKHEQKGIKHGITAVIKNPFITEVNQSINFCLLINDNGNKKAIHFLLKNDGSKYTGEETNLDNCNSVCFLAKNRYLTLQLNKLASYDVANSQNKIPIDTGTISAENIDSIYQGPHGKFILKFKNGIVALFDVNTKKVVQEITELTNMKYVIWNNSMTYCALVGETGIFLTNKQMEIITKIKEKSSIKSVCFDENNVLFYTTYFHVKYVLTEPGLNGIVKSTENPLYLMSVSNSVLYYSTSNQSIESMSINYSDIKFKLDLLNKNYENIVSSLNQGTVYGLKAVEIIQNAGFPDLSLKFVKDPKEKFFLALKSGKLEEAKEAAEKLRENVYYEKLAEKAMMMGKLDIAEFCYVKSYNLDKLIFFYTISGRQDKLNKIAVALKNTEDNSRRFLNSLYTCNVNEKIEVLKSTGHNNLALLMAKLNDREDDINELNEKAKSEKKEIAFNEADYEEIKKNMKPIMPLKPVVGIKNKEYHSNWLSLTEIKKSSQQSSIDNILNQKEDEMQEGEGAIFNQLDSNYEDAVSPGKLQEKAKQKEDAQKKKLDKWKDDNEDEDPEEIQRMLAEAQKNEQAKATTLTQKDLDLLHRKSSKSLLAGVQLALGNYKLALSFLKSQLGIKDYSKLKPIIKDIRMSAYTQMKVMPYCPSINFDLRHPRSKALNSLIPQNGVTIARLQILLTKGYELVSEFEMGEALKVFQDILKYSIFFIATDSDEEAKAKSIIKISREYIYLTKFSLIADSFKEKDKVKYCNTVCLMSLCQLELSEHKFLIYKKAKYCCKSIKNFITAIHFVKKMLGLEKELYSVFEKELNKNKEELDLFQKIGTNQHQLEFDPNEINEISSAYTSIKLEKVNLNESVINCPLCSSIERKSAKNSTCGICDLCVLGESIIGLKLLYTK